MYILGLCTTTVESSTCTYVHVDTQIYMYMYMYSTRSLRSTIVERSFNGESVFAEWHSCTIFSSGLSSFRSIFVPFCLPDIKTREAQGIVASRHYAFSKNGRPGTTPMLDLFPWNVQLHNLNKWVITTSDHPHVHALIST